MKRKNTIWSLVLALVMVLGVIAPLSALAASTTEPTEEKTESVTLHKILMDKKAVEEFTDKLKGQNTTNGTKGLDDSSYVGNAIGDVAKFFAKDGKASEIAKVYFAWQFNDGGTWKYIKASATDKKAPLLNGSNLVSTDSVDEAMGGLTEANGIEFVTKALPKGDYRIVEVKEKSEYAKEDGSILAESIAVPVVIKLPVVNDKGVVTKVHVYPKNTEDKPTVDKFVVKNGEDVKKASFDMTKEHTWAIEAKIPTGFKDYKYFELVDTLQNALSYVKGQAKAGTITVEVGTKSNNVFTKEASAEATLTKDTDYTITEPTEAQGGVFKVKLTDAGIQKLAKLEMAKGDAKDQAGFEGKLIRVEFKTTINENAIMGTEIPNDVVLKYGHNPDEKKAKETKPETPPDVVTGGKKFKKIDSGESNKALQGAKFVVKNGEGKYLAEVDGKYNWVDVANENVETLKNADLKLKVLESNTDGKFEIKGLEYDLKNGTKYYLKEIEAPKDYALLADPIPFLVNATSYKDNNEGYDAGTHDEQGNQLVDNKKITIPQTGGMGTMIFMVAGLALMGGAFIAMRKRSAEQA